MTNIQQKYKLKETRDINNTTTTENFSIMQGNTFRKNKKKVREGFDGTGNLETQTRDMLAKTTVTSGEKETVKKLYTEFTDTLSEYKHTLKGLKTTYKDHFGRVDPKNKYLNKSIRFTTGHVCYVTNQGVVRWIPSHSIWDSCGAPKDAIHLKIPIPSGFFTVGTKIETDPPLVSGPNVDYNEQLGNEGKTVFVTEEIDPSLSVTALNTYAINSDGSQRMHFPIGSPPHDLIQNGNFDYPAKNNNYYAYINDNTTIPHWNFINACLMNNCSAWKYPIPYPKGNQAISIQRHYDTAAQITTNINIDTTGDYTLSFYACGRPCCNGTNPLSFTLSEQSGSWSSQNTITPTYNEWNQYTIKYTISTAAIYQLLIEGTQTSGDSSSAIQGISFIMTQSDSTTLTWDDCKAFALQGGNKFFGLQDVNTSTEKGYCGVSTNEILTTGKGISYVDSLASILWSSNTSSDNVSSPGSYAYMNNAGSLEVYDENNSVIWSSPLHYPGDPSYWGCYKDNATRAIPTYLTNSATSVDDIMNEASAKGSSIYGVQWKHGSTPVMQGWSGTDLDQARQYGKATNCTKQDGLMVGGGMSNALYGIEPGFDSFVVVRDDENLAIYRGQNENDNQHLIWSTGTNGKTGTPSATYASKNGTFAVDYMITGQKLQKGQWIGSKNGNVVLIMQDDGNLVLHAVANTINKVKLTNGQYAGGKNATFVYEFENPIIPTNMGKIGYIGPDSKIYTYSSDDVTLGSNYSKITDTDNLGSDYKVNTTYISYDNATVEDCENTCNTYDDCNGFVYDNNTTRCYPKNSGISYSGTGYMQGVDLYTRNKTNTSTSKNSNAIDIDTNAWETYTSGGDISEYKNSVYNIATEANPAKLKLKQLEAKMKQISTTINQSTGSFSMRNEMVQKQVKTDSDTLEAYLNELKINDELIGEMGNANTLSTMLNDSNVFVLQKSSSYLILSIIAIGLILIILNVSKK